jgi:hypothetical protein
VPDALVYHHISRERMTVQYLRARMANQGACDLYSNYHRTLPKSMSILGRACRLLVKNTGIWISAAVKRDRTDVRSLKVQLEAARTQAQLRYMLKIALNKKFQNFVAKKNWLHDLRPPQNSPGGSR